MRGHGVRFYGEIFKITDKLSLLPNLIWSIESTGELFARADSIPPHLTQTPDAYTVQDCPKSKMVLFILVLSSLLAKTNGR